MQCESELVYIAYITCSVRVLQMSLVTCLTALMRAVGNFKSMEIILQKSLLAMDMYPSAGHAGRWVMVLN